MSRKCSNPLCSNIIPWIIKLNGKTISLTKRKFCLSCSPYGSRNTRADINKIYKKRERYSKWSKEEKQLHQARVYKRGYDRKWEAVRLKGGKCEICGYNKSLRALQFHHIDRKTKLFALDVKTISKKNWDLVLTEIEKCQLLCSNCHCEIEEQYSEVNFNTYKSILQNNELKINTGS